MANMLKLPQLAWHGTKELELPNPDKWQVEMGYMAGYDRPALSPDEIADRILALDPSSPVGHLTKGLALAKSRGSFPESLQEFRRAANLDSSDPSILVMHAYFAALVGFDEEGLRISEKVVSLDPLSPVARLNLSFILFLTGNQDAAALEAERAVMLDPTSPGWCEPLSCVRLIVVVKYSSSIIVYRRSTQC